MNVVLTWSGEVDYARRDELRRQLREAFDTPQLTSLTIDLAAVKFLDSSGLGLLAQAQGWAKDRRVGMVVSRPSIVVQRLFDLTGLRSVFTIVETPSSAGSEPR